MDDGLPLACSSSDRSDDVKVNRYTHLVEHVHKCLDDHEDEENYMSSTLLAPSDKCGTLDTSAIRTITGLEERNRIAKLTIKRYADRHAVMDVAIGGAGFFGLAIPALIMAIAAQSAVIYQPLARELSDIYNSDVDERTKNIVKNNLVLNGAADIANEFGTEFISSVAFELVTEAGLGAMAGFIPVVGGLVGAALDYVIATAMTWRVGSMVAIYYQNGGEWVGDRKHTLELAKEMVGGTKFGLHDLVSRFTGADRPQVNVDLNSIPTRIPEVFESQMRALRPLVAMLLKVSTNDFVRTELSARGISPSLIDAVLRGAVAATA